MSSNISDFDQIDSQFKIGFGSPFQNRIIIAADKPPYLNGQRTCLLSIEVVRSNRTGGAHLLLYQPFSVAVKRRWQLAQRTTQREISAAMDSGEYP